MVLFATKFIPLLLTQRMETIYESGFFAETATNSDCDFDPSVYNEICVDENAACTLNGDVYQCSCVYGNVYDSSTDSCEQSKHSFNASLFMGYFTHSFIKLIFTYTYVV